MKNPVTVNSMTRREFAATMVSSGVGLALVSAGCGGSRSGSSQSAPNQTTRARVLAMHDVSVRGVTQSGFQPQSLAYARNSYSEGGADDGGAPSSGASGPNSPMPLLGAFLRNVAAAPAPSRAAHLRYRNRQATGGSAGISMPPDPDYPPTDFPIEPLPTFYFDYYLGLWVQIEESAGESRYLLFEDEAKTVPAGHITTVNPTDWESFPWVFRSHYEFTRGYLAGSHGSSENTTNADYSGSSRYENVYADGWKDKGSSNWSARGDFSWSSRMDGANNEWSEGAGSFRADGSGGTWLSSSDGYKSDYRYNADGSGHGRITGPDPGLPVSISWDAFGNTMIVYADGTVEHVSGWGSGSGDGDGEKPIPVDAEVVSTAF